MKDKFKDEDDVIIDLTDLLEEGTPPGEEAKPEEEGGAVEDATLGTEPDTFDLGKEIAMEDDVSVEDIEDVDESLNVDVAISSDEEAVLTEEEPSEEVTELQAPAEVDEASAQPEEEIVQPEEEIDTPPTEEVAEPPEEEMQAPISEAEQIIEESPAEVSTGLDVTGTDVQEIKKEIPAMLEGVVRPIVGELIKEVISATRDLLPGIVERVIREEIEKLKKIE
ncbi:MAG: hypothetical protein J7L53_09140 [Deltaproteobacteria bacterium]|nr:hypothetical protein [Deltaproteobacteria bacterium]